MKKEAETKKAKKQPNKKKKTTKKKVVEKVSKKVAKKAVKKTAKTKTKVKAKEKKTTTPKRLKKTPEGMNFIDKQIADRYLLNGGNMAEAYQFGHPRAKANTCWTEGPKILSKPEVVAYIKARQEKLSKKAEIDQNTQILRSEVLIKNLMPQADYREAEEEKKIVLLPPSIAAINTIGGLMRFQNDTLGLNADKGVNLTGGESIASEILNKVRAKHNS